MSVAFLECKKWWEDVFLRLLPPFPSPLQHSCDKMCITCMCRGQSRCKRVCEESRSAPPPSSSPGSTCRRWRVALSCCRTRPPAIAESKLSYNFLFYNHTTTTMTTIIIITKRPEQLGELGPHKQGEPQRFRGQTRLRPRTTLPGKILSRCRIL